MSSLSMMSLLDDDVTSLLAMCFSIGEKKSRFQRMNCLIIHIYKDIIIIKNNFIQDETKSRKATPEFPQRNIFTNAECPTLAILLLLSGFTNKTGLCF